MKLPVGNGIFRRYIIKIFIWIFWLSRAMIYTFIKKKNENILFPKQKKIVLLVSNLPLKGNSISPCQMVNLDSTDGQT